MLLCWMKVTQTHAHKKRKSSGGAERVRLEIDRPKRADTTHADRSNGQAPVAAAKEHNAGEKSDVSAGSKGLTNVKQKTKKDRSGKAEESSAAGAASEAAHAQPDSGGAEVSAGAAQVKQDQAKARLATFAKPTLGKPSKKKKKAGAGHQQEQQAAAEANLTKAQRKNLWRKRRREAMRNGQTGG